MSICDPHERSTDLSLTADPEAALMTGSALLHLYLGLSYAPPHLGGDISAYAPVAVPLTLDPTLDSEVLQSPRSTPTLLGSLGPRRAIPVSASQVQAPNHRPVDFAVDPEQTAL